MKKILVLVLLFILIGTAACGISEDAQANDRDETEIIYHSDISTEDCYLCGNGIESIVPSYWGQENVAFISLNTFDIKPIEINRYDRIDGHLITEAAGVVSFGGGGSKDGGFSATLLQEYDRGYATGTMDFHDDEVLDIEKVSSFLCSDCMNEILPQRVERCYGVGIINLSSKEIQLFEGNLTGFGVGDFHIEWYQVEQNADSCQVHVLIFYCPVRYTDNG